MIVVIVIMTIVMVIVVVVVVIIKTMIIIVVCSLIMQMASLNDTTAPNPPGIPNSWENPGFSAQFLHQHHFLGTKKVMGQRVLHVLGEIRAPEGEKMLWHWLGVSRPTPRHENSPLCLNHGKPASARCRPGTLCSHRGVLTLKPNDDYVNSALWPPLCSVVFKIQWQEIAAPSSPLHHVGERWMDPDLEDACASKSPFTCRIQPKFLTLAKPEPKKGWESWCLSCGHGTEPFGISSSFSHLAASNPLML